MKEATAVEPDKPVSVQLWVALTLKQRAQAAAKREDLSFAQYMRRALVEKLEREAKPAQR